MTTEESVVDVSQDWVLACDVQQHWMHGPSRKSVSSVDLSGRCRQLRAIGGDCYYCNPLTNDRVALVVGDASGKGLAAALMIASVQSSLRTAAYFTDDLRTLFKTVNHEAYTSSLDHRYATAFYSVFDIGTGVLRYVNAGHNPPVILRYDGAIEWLQPSGPPVGMFPDSIYQETVVRLSPGDLVIAYTDGVVEATDTITEKEWGVEGFLTAAAMVGTHSPRSAEQIVQQIFESLDEFSGGQQTDDATVAVLRVI